LHSCLGCCFRNTLSTLVFPFDTSSLLLVCAIATAAPTTWKNLASKPYSYTDYTTEFGKVASIERQAIFETNLAKILAHNIEPQWTYKMGVNQFTDYTAAEFKAYYAGYSKDHAIAKNFGGT
jgi:hypothetical protein